MRCPDTFRSPWATPGVGTNVTGSYEDKCYFCWIFRRPIPDPPAPSLGDPLRRFNLKSKSLIYTSSMVVVTSSTLTFDLKLLVELRRDVRLSQLTD